MLVRQLLISLTFALTALNALAKPALPNGAKFAVSLSYDDALASQLDNAVPVLNRYGFHASFYLFLASPVFNARLEEWRALAAEGHELGNHTLYHVCSGRGPDRAWVPAYANLDERTVEHMRLEITLANNMLQALDGRTERTFTIPCGDTQAKDGNYVSAVQDQFIALKGQGIMDGSEVLYTPSNISGKELINLLEKASPSATIVSFLFHGIGGDHLSVSTEAHNELLKYLDKHRDKYWVDSFINIHQYLQTRP